VSKNATTNDRNRPPMRLMSAAAFEPELNRARNAERARSTTTNDVTLRARMAADTPGDVWNCAQSR